MRQAYVVACVGSVEIRHNGKARCHCRSWRGEVKNYVGASAECVLQEPQLGTGHATMQAESLLKGKTDYVIVTYADMPSCAAKPSGDL